jgi:hypothetical protein
MGDKEIGKAMPLTIWHDMFFHYLSKFIDEILKEK